MRPIVTDRGAWSVGLSVCRSVTLLSPAKTAEPIKVPFGLTTLVGPVNNVLNRVHGKGQFLGRKKRAIAKYRDTLYGHLCKKS